MTNLTRRFAWPAMFAALALMLLPASAHAAAYIKLDGIDGESVDSSNPGMRVTDDMTIAIIIRQAASIAGTSPDNITLTWNGRELDPSRTLGSYRIRDRVATFVVHIESTTPPRLRSRGTRSPHE